MLQRSYCDCSNELNSTLSKSQLFLHIILLLKILHFILYFCILFISSNNIETYDVHMSLFYSTISSVSAENAVTLQIYLDITSSSTKVYVTIASWRIFAKQEAICAQLRAKHVEQSHATLIARLSVLMAVATRLSKVPLNVV